VQGKIFNVTIGRAAWEECSATWNLGTNSAFALGPMKTTENLRVGQCSLKLKLIYDRQSVGQSALVSGTHQGPVTNFSFSLKFPLDSCGFVIL
jgi:hypothetical protein